MLDSLQACVAIPENEADDRVKTLSAAGKNTITNLEVVARAKSEDFCAVDRIYKEALADCIAAPNETVREPSIKKYNELFSAWNKAEGDNTSASAALCKAQMHFFLYNTQSTDGVVEILAAATLYAVHEHYSSN
jgi:hypothetical protein